MKRTWLYALLISTFALIIYPSDHPYDHTHRGRDLIKNILKASMKGLIFTLLTHKYDNNNMVYRSSYDDDYRNSYYHNNSHKNSYDYEPESHPENSHIVFYPAKYIKTNFASIAGNTEAKNALQHIVHYLKNPSKYKDIGAKCSKGILFSGPAGTGKTFLAQALAGEAKCNFITASGSDFVEVYVGQGAKRIREIFEMAKNNSPCIIFFDEFDSLAQKRGGAYAQEYDHALNQLLAEMDGFDKDNKSTVIIIAATNNKELIDHAALRSGRFDQAIEMNLPNEQERKEILKIHIKKVKYSQDINLNAITKITHGFSGADLANLVNQAALLAVKNNKDKVDQAELEEATKSLQKKVASDSIFNVYPQGSVKENFSAVAGNYEAKEALGDIIQFLNQPSTYYKLGAQPPLGILLTGEPGTGKTLLARATAGQANCSFISLSGSDFVDRYAGTATSKIKHVFKEARKCAPCIVFIDEIDAIAHRRVDDDSGIALDHNQTVTQLLVELDGFAQQSKNQPIIILGATNNPDLLDPAMLRPGRFDKVIQVPLPDLHCRTEILKVHLKKIHHSLTNDHIQKIASGTPGFSGADLANLVNQAALVALKEKDPVVKINHFEEARDVIMIGSKSPSMKISKKELEVTAYHEAGHALIRILLNNHKQILHKVTITPRGGTLGYAECFPAEESYDISKDEMLCSIAIALGGRIAEELQCKTITAGAHSDFVHATKTARAMVCQYGMSDFGTQVLLHGYIYSQQTLEKIDFEVTKILKTQYELAKSILQNNSDKLHKLAKALLEKETLYASEIYKLLGLTPPKTEFSLL